MLEKFSINSSYAVFGKNECTYQCLLEDFKKTDFIGVMTFNISPKNDSSLLAALKSACLKGAKAVIITNIPKRYPNYYGYKYALDAKKNIDMYMNHLNPALYGMRLSPYFSFKNHAKIIMTDNMIYWGSSNFSDESFANLECGTISTDKELIEFVRDTLFSEIQRESVPYFKYNFAVAIANLESLIPACKSARQHLFDATFEPWSDYDTNFEEKWIYRIANSGLTDKFLQKFIDFFSSFDDALNVIADIINEYCELDELPEQVEELSDLFEEYKKTYDAFYDNISALFENLKPVAKYDASAEACKIISDKYGMEAYDENLDYYVEKAENETMTFYEELITASEHTVRDTLECLDSMIQYLEGLNETLHELLEVNPKIDNTDV